MPAYSTSTVNMSGNSGSIVIQIGDTGGGGDVTYTLDTVVSVQSSSYIFTGGNPPASSTFGNNGARWDDITFTTGQTVTLTYYWSRTTPVSSDYVVALINGDGTFHTHWGTIPGISQP